MTELAVKESRIACMDLETPRNAYLSAFYKRSFAYYTVKDRMPIILTQTIDTLVRHKDLIARENPAGASEDLKQVISKLSELKYEIQTNKTMRHLKSNAPDVEFYNRYCDEQSTKGHKTYFNAIWLHVECYMYRRIREAFELTKVLTSYDPYRHIKGNAFFGAVQQMRALGQHLMSLDPKKMDKRTEFIKLLKINLWGNKCDLSLSNGAVEANNTLPVDLNEMNSNILSDHSRAIWGAASDHRQKLDTIDIIFDNGGYELFTDFCLADFMITNGICKKIRFYVKAMPWFISDVTYPDVDWFLEHLRKTPKQDVTKELADRWTNYLSKKVWTVEQHDFWTLPVDFSYMAKVDTALYKKLADAKLVIFKGDLNYRKLFGEKNWDPTTPVNKALQRFQPTKLCTLRTVKSDIIVGLEKGVAEKLSAKDTKWMQSGNYGVIQMCDQIHLLK